LQKHRLKKRVKGHEAKSWDRQVERDNDKVSVSFNKDRISGKSKMKWLITLFKWRF